MRTRCARLARVARGESVDACPPVAANITAGLGEKAPKLGERSPKLGERAEEDESWVMARVQEAAAAMETGRRWALEEEIEWLVSLLTSLRDLSLCFGSFATTRQTNTLTLVGGGGCCFFGCYVVLAPFTLLVPCTMYHRPIFDMHPPNFFDLVR